MQSLQSRISSSFHELSPQLRRAARYLLDHQFEVATQSLRQVARNGDLPPATLSRVARALGYSDYEDLRDSCRVSLQPKTNGLADRAASMQNEGRTYTDSETNNFALRHSLKAVENIQSMMSTLDVTTLDTLVDTLVESRQVALVGARSSRSMIDYLANMASLALPNWTVVGGTGYSAALVLAELDARCTVLAISIAPYLRSTVDFTQHAANTGATVVSITDSVESPVHEFATQNFVVPVESEQFFPSHIALLTLIESLMGMVVSKTGIAARNRIEAVERMTHATGDYL